MRRFIITIVVLLAFCSCDQKSNEQNAGSNIMHGLNIKIRDKSGKTMFTYEKSYALIFAVSKRTSRTKIAQS